MPALTEPKLIEKIAASSFYIPIEKLPAFQDLMGGVPRGTITAFLGAPGAGKTTIAFQLAIEVAKAEKGNVIIFDTENSFHTYLELASPISARYDMDINIVRVNGNVEQTGSAKDPKYEIKWEFEDDIDPKATNVFVIHQPDITPITTMFGRGVDLKIYESGKFKVMMTPGAWANGVPDIPLSIFFTKHKCKVLVVDSVTNPLDEIPAVGENFPARADLTQIWMIQMHKLAAHFNIPILATFHESKNDTSPFSKGLKIEGGKGVAYNLKFIVYMLLQNEIGLLPKAAVKPRTLASDTRAMFIARHPSPSRRPWKEPKYLTITAQGLVDGSEPSDSDEDDTE